MGHAGGGGSKGGDMEVPQGRERLGNNRITISSRPAFTEGDHKPKATGSLTSEAGPRLSLCLCPAVWASDGATIRAMADGTWGCCYQL